MAEKILVIGCGGHAKSVVDAIEAAGQFDIAGFVGTPQELAFTYRGYRVLGTDDDLPAIYAGGVRYAALGVGYLGEGRVRERLADRLTAAGFTLPPVIDPTAAVATDAVLGEGIFVGKQAVVNAAAAVDRLAIVNTAAVVEHDCRVGASSHVAVGALLCGGVTVGEHALVGAGATVLQGLTVGNNARVGAGATVLVNVPADTTAVGLVKRE